MKEKKYEFAISACLCKERVRYNGGHCFDEKCYQLYKAEKALMICPEVMGGLKVPRLSSEIRGAKVVNNQNEDVTNIFVEGAIQAIELLKKHQIKKVILKDKSPSCGSSQIYDGTFSGKLIAGQGVFAKMCLDNDIEIIDVKTL